MERSPRQVFDPTIYYVLPIAGDDDSLTSFQGFSRGACAAAHLIGYMRGLPTSAIELQGGYDKRMLLACGGVTPYQVVALNTVHLHHVKPEWERPFVVVLSWDNTDAAVAAWIALSSPRPLHVTNAPGVGDITLDGLCEETVGPFVKRRLKELSRRGLFGGAPTELLAALLDVPPRTMLDFPSTGHNAVVPNEYVLERAGHQFPEVTPFNPGAGDQPCIDAIVRSARRVLMVREEQPDLRTPAFIITCPGISTAMERHFLERVAKESDPSKLRLAAATAKAWRWIRSERGYFYTSSDPEFAFSDYSQAVMAERAEELFAYTHALDIRAASDVSAVLRLPPAIRACSAATNDIARCHSGRAPRQVKLKKLATMVPRLQEKLRSSCPKELLELVDTDPTGVRVISDLPLEWLPLRDGQPLAFRHTCSRIPCTPGNVMFQTTLPRKKIRLRREALHGLLVVRSFAAGDPLRDLLAFALEQLTTIVPELNIQLVDITTSAQLIQALDAFDGCWFIFDGHGQRDELSSSLVIGEETVDLMSFRGKVRIPPIAIPLACWMHPVDGKHTSAGNAFLACGARTVVGSLMPLDGVDAAMFAARLAHTAIHVLTNLFEAGASEVSWATLFSITQQSRFVSEAAAVVAGAYPKMDEDAIAAVGVSTSAAICNRERAWYGDCLAGFARAAGCAPRDIKSLLARKLPLPECLLYVQLGDPESIVFMHPRLCSGATMIADPDDPLG
jgi:hypothetical protein